MSMLRMATCGVVVMALTSLPGCKSDPSGTVQETGQPVSQPAIGESHNRPATRAGFRGRVWGEPLEAASDLVRLRDDVSEAYAAGESIRVGDDALGSVPCTHPTYYAVDGRLHHVVVRCDAADWAALIAVLRQWYGEPQQLLNDHAWWMHEGVDVYAFVQGESTLEPRITVLFSPALQTTWP